MSGDNKYCFDSSAFIDSWRRYYSPTCFEPLWTTIGNFIKDGRIIFCKEVEKEVATGNDDLNSWLKKMGNCVPYSTEQLQIVSEIVNKYPKVSQYHKTRPNHADPFVVALAKEKGAIVVTWEGANGDKINPAIPDLCREYRVDCCNMLDLFQRENWSFSHT